MRASSSPRWSDLAATMRRSTRSPRLPRRALGRAADRDPRRVRGVDDRRPAAPGGLQGHRVDRDPARSCARRRSGRERRCSTAPRQSPAEQAVPAAAPATEPCKRSGGERCLAAAELDYAGQPSRARRRCDAMRSTEGTGRSPATRCGSRTSTRCSFRREGRAAATHQARPDPLLRQRRPDAGAAPGRPGLNLQRFPDGIGEGASGRRTCPATRPSGSRAGRTPAARAPKDYVVVDGVGHARLAGPGGSDRAASVDVPTDAPRRADLRPDRHRPGRARRPSRRCSSWPGCTGPRSSTWASRPAQGDRQARHPDLGADRAAATVRRDARLGGGLSRAVGRRCRSSSAGSGRRRRAAAGLGSTSPRTRSTRRWWRRTRCGRSAARRSRRRSAGRSWTTRPFARIVDDQDRCEAAARRLVTCLRPRLSWPRSCPRYRMQASETRPGGGRLAGTEARSSPAVCGVGP